MIELSAYVQDGQKVNNPVQSAEKNAGDLQKTK